MIGVQFGLLLNDDTQQVTGNTSGRKRGDSVEQSVALYKSTVAAAD